MTPDPNMPAEVAGEPAALADTGIVTKTEEDGQHPADHYLVVEDPSKPSTWHLRVRDVEGKLDHRLMGAAWAALHEGYRGNKYAGPQKRAALAKLKELYAAEGMPLPGTDEPPQLSEPPTEPVRVMLDETGSIWPTESGHGRVYRAVAIRPGEWKGHGLYCPPEVLRRNAHKFNGLASFLNPGPPQAGQHGHPAIQTLLGVFDNARWDEAEQAVVGEYYLADTPAARWFKRFADDLIQARQAGRRVPDVGLSAVPWVRVAPRPDGTRAVVDILGVEQLDAVYKPAAGGEIQRILAAQPPGEMPMSDENLNPTTPIPAPAAAPVPADDATVQEELAAELLNAQRGAVLTARLATSGLPAELQDLVAQSLPANWRLADLDQALQRARLAWAKLEERRTVQGVTPTVTGMQDGLDRITEALTALLERRQPRNGVPPLSGIREAYIALSGDYEMTGMFHAERVQLANVNSTTMANIVANVLNKRVMQTFQTYPRWWEPIVVEEEFTTLQTIRWIKLGGLGSLPTVAEGAAYTELTWDDSAETTSWTKKGGYLGLTLEAMDKDDVNRLRSAPLALAQAAYLTLAKDVANIFTANSGVGPTLADGLALFHSSHSNLGSSALSASSWAATRVAMRKQTELNSGERLGGLVVPKYLLVPPDLEQTGLIVLGSEGYPGTSDNDINPEAEGATHDARLAAARRRLIVVDFWTDTNNWAAVGDPQLYPGIGIGYRFGKTPEIFSVASPNSGLMFTNDTMPIKVRWLYAVGVIDYRPLYKHNVS